MLALAGLAAGTVAAGGVAAGAVAAPAPAGEFYPRPWDGVVSLSGHGFGHGHGLSQWGAYGAAKQGLSWEQITDFYYPGTGRTAIGNPTVRVKVDGYLGRSARVLPEPGLEASFGADRSSPWALPTEEASGRKILEYQVVAEGSQARLVYKRDDGATVRWSLSPNAQISVRNTQTGVVKALTAANTRISYSGELRGTVLNGGVTPVVATPLDTYLRGVVPSEMPASWPAAALGAQAVAARSYAHYDMQHPQSAYYDTCDTTWCQVFKGNKWESALGSVTTVEWAASNAAIAATAGVVRTYAGSTAFTQFSAANGGYAAAGSQPYLAAKADPYDGVVANSGHSWETTVSVAAIERAWPSIGSYRGMRVTERDGNGEWGGRVRRLTLEGSAGTTTITGERFRTTFGLRSEWFVPTNPTSAPSFPRDVSADRKADVLAVDAGNGTLRAYRGTGTGGWQGVDVVGAGWGQFRKVFTAGAWDGDAVSDVMGVGEDGSLWFYPTATGGTFGTPRVIGWGWSAFDTVFPVGDFSGDGLTDLLARRHADGALLLYTGDGQGGFAGTARQVGAGWQGFTSVFSPGDLTGDGTSDVVARAADGTLFLYPGNGVGGWQARRAIGAGWNAFSSIVSPGDFTGDRATDILARAWDGTLWMYPTNGRGGFLPRKAVGSGWNVFSAILP